MRSINTQSGKRLKRAIKAWILKAVWGYDDADLLKCLRCLGLRQGDTVMVHCGFNPSGGFRGSPQELVEVFLTAVGSTGTVAMMSMPYHGISSYEYLRQEKVFDLRRGVSMMGIVTDVFRRRNDVIRSLHPTHPVTVWGSKSKWLVSGQLHDLSPFGDNSPFARLVETDGKVLLFNVPFNTMTFEHYLEHRIQEYLPIPMYRPEPMTGLVIDQEGQLQKIQTLVLSEEINRSRRSAILETTLIAQGALKLSRLGRTRLMLGQASEMVEVVFNMIRQRQSFHVIES